jgi:OOP family OmpA-OmpF porin
VLVGDEPEGKIVLENIAKAGDCGFFTNSDNLLSCHDIIDYVKKIFCFSDRDGDGVPDDKDNCPDDPDKTDPGICGCGTPDTDKDKDGVPDCNDICPNTPENVTVDDKGCWVIEVPTDVLFDFDKYIIKPEGLEILNKIAVYLEQDPKLHIEINGHTDNFGSEEYNLDLSIKRSNAGVRYLLKKGDYQGRITIKGFGFSRPKATNDTPEGRSKNRRIEFNMIQNNH